MSEQKKPIYKRVLLKLSGEALQGKASFGIDPAVLEHMVQAIAEVAKLGVEIGIVIGGGNLFRGAALSAVGIDRVTGDQMGMLATVMNALAMRDALENIDITTQIMSAIPISGLVEPFDRRQTIHYLQQKHVVIFAGGTGNPLVTTDSAASLRGIEIKADVLLKATNVDGIYSADPTRNPKAELYHHLTYQEATEKELGIMDINSFFQCRDHGLSIRVFNINSPGILHRIITGSNEGTLVDARNSR